jgi:bisphosphoglycerate-independent phosphoglycerate mutase (AlkP superfamily)
MLFWDGVGIGKKDAATNPLVAADLPVLRRLLDGEICTVGKKRITGKFASCIPLDAMFGLEGLPQSGTGQSAIFAGVDIAGTTGKHFGPYAPASLRRDVEEKNIFRRIHALGLKSAFANAYPQRYFDYLASPRARQPVVSLAARSAGLSLNGHRELAAGKAVSADITARRWKEFGHHDVEAVAPATAGRLFYQLSHNTDFVLFEYFLTDKAGHEQSMGEAVDVLQRFDAFIGGILECWNPRHDTLLIASDHGNIEDLSTKSHTRNKVPFIIAGAGRKHFLQHVGSLSDITPAVVSYCASCGKINRL